MIKYPNDFKNSIHNAAISDETINSWIEEGIAILNNKPYTPYYRCWSGDTMVIIFTVHEEDGGGFEVLVNKNFDRAYHENEIH